MLLLRIFAIVLLIALGAVIGLDKLPEPDPWLSCVHLMMMMGCWLFAGLLLLTRRNGA